MDSRPYTVLPGKEKKKSVTCKEVVMKVWWSSCFRSGHENVVDVMIQRGAPISAKTKNGLAPLHMASQGDHVDAAR